MTDTITPDVHTLAGPYVLDALPAGERDAFEEHIQHCQTCAADIAGMRRVAVRLGGAVAVPAPSLLKARTLTEVRRTRQLSPLLRTSTAVQARHHRLGRRSVLALAAELVAVAATGVAVDQHRDGVDERRANDALIEVLSQSDARTVRGNLSSGGRATVVSSVRSDAAVVVLHNLTRPPGGRTYQLWLIDKGQQAHSIGLVTGDRTDEQLEVNGAGLADKVMFGVTVEPGGGSPEPTLPAAALIALV